MSIGFLLFERPDGSARLIAAEDLKDNLFGARVGLVVLSACQGAALDAEGDPMASVAGRLTATGISAILAMTHAVLAVTTQALFGHFYASLAQGKGIAAALDDARAWLANNPAKFEVQRGRERRPLTLDDWFLLALYHGGTDAPLLTRDAAPASNPEPTRHNLRPAHEAGFFGRRRELWQIERWLSAETRRLTLSGFGGQGKTELALEAARWLLRTGPYRRAVFVDYAQVAADDALAVAVSTLASVLGENLADAEAAGRALAAVPTLVILDNLESVPPAGLGPLLAAAAAWSNQGATRLLLTTRRPELDHPDYRIQGTRRHRRIALAGLGSAAEPDDALDWYAALGRLPLADAAEEVPPPSQEALIALFDQVAFHPLSIAVLAQQLRTRSAKQLGARLTALLDAAAVSAIAQEGTPASLLASLRLSLERLSPEQRQVVGRLGVFQGGAFEDDLLAITGLGEGQEDAGGPTASHPHAAPWPALRRQLESAGLIAAERLPGVTPPFLRFHPTLAPLLWAGLDGAEREALTRAHRQRYHQLANFLYHADDKHPDEARAIARRELPNLLHAVDRALAAEDPDAVDFVDSVNRFLDSFGRTREAAALTRRAEAAAGAPGSQAWFLAQSNRGERLLASGQAGEAAACFQAIFATLGEAPSDALALTLGRLGRCYAAGGRPDLAETEYRRGITVTKALEQTDQVRRHRAILHTDLGDVLSDLGRFAEARAAYETSLAIKQEIGGDPRGEGVVLGQLGTLALQEGDRAEAIRRYQAALTLFQRLGEPATEATVRHQLGIAFQAAGRWEEAEGQYRESARLEEQRGNRVGAATTWNQLAWVCEATKQPAAETWYCKAIDGFRASGDTAGLSVSLGNLATFLQTLPGRLVEARRLAEEALAIKETLDPGAAEIWKTYGLLAEIADQKQRPEAAADYRRLAREAKRRFAGTAHELQRFASLIAAVVQAVGGQAEARAAVEELIGQYQQAGGENAAFVDALQRILAGERDPEALCARLSWRLGPVVEFTLQALADPATLDALLDAGDDTP